MGQSHPKAAEIEVLGRRLGAKKLEAARQAFREITGKPFGNDEDCDGTFDLATFQKAHTFRKSPLVARQVFRHYCSFCDDGDKVEIESATIDWYTFLKVCTVEQENENQFVFDVFYGGGRGERKELEESIRSLLVSSVELTGGLQLANSIHQRERSDHSCTLRCIMRTLDMLLEGEAYMTSNPPANSERLTFDAFRRMKMILPSLYCLQHAVSSPFTTQKKRISLPFLDYSRSLHHGGQKSNDLHLPPELWSKIASHLDDARDKAAFSLVCRGFLQARRRLEGKQVREAEGEGSLLTKERAWLLRSLLMGHKSWTQLYHSDRQGKAFATFMSEIVEKSQTLVLCKATDGCVFGCFAPCEWHKSAQFYGKDLGGHGSYVFSLSDSARIYKCSGWNTNFQYLASGCQSGINPNGLGMGGQVKHFAFYLDSSLDFGHSFPSATFNNSTLLSDKKETDFEVDVIEVWAPSESVSDGSGGEGRKKGVLKNEKFNTDKKILQFAGMFNENARNR